ncbi:olfactory receptor 52E8-like [Anguilla anguilla]|uniref:olfactory receptor 52E8-like n=1 Tax=Anguilla anguilla TaxID=7936 RepID=UPI0015A92599|nr:olfactory receptor 52E8-like [Anguilla anguilla]XP_035240450.1 olfactory receptor 52E8-like [Anguilla anguilla]
MASMNSIHSLNTTFVHPSFFFINGFYNVPHAKYYYVFLCFVFGVSVLGNSFVIFIIYIERSFHTPKYMAIFNLVVADLGESTALIPNLIATFLFNSQYISFDACMANMFFVFFFSCLQALTLTVLAYDRLVAICLPLRYHAIITMQAMTVILTVVWAYNSLFLISTVALVTRLSFCKSIVVKSYFCDHGPIYTLACNDNLVNYIIAKINIAFFLYLPFILTVLSYVFIGGALFKLASWEGRFKAMKTCSAHLMLVAVYYLPIMGTYIAAAAGTLHPNARIINTSLANAIPPMLNPIIYVLNTEEVKEFSKRLLKRKKKTTEIINQMK